MTVLDALVLAASAIAASLASIRWLRIAQREHYLPGSVLRFARRWWGRDALDVLGALVAFGATVACGFAVATGFVTAAIVALGPRGLGVRGRTAKLAWTSRLQTIAALVILAIALAIVLGAVTGGVHAGAVIAAALALGAPLVVELALAIDAPIEASVTGRYVASAKKRLAQVSPTVVAITGSYGKTSTKRFVEHLVGGSRSVVASPRSFNNRAGLARAVNEALLPGTEIFVAEMGTYGPGEIAALVDWIPPQIAAITAIGPVHLERFGSLERTLVAKSEILAGAETVVLNVDDELLAGLALGLAAEGRSVRRCSGIDPHADVAVVGAEGKATLYVSGDPIGDFVVDARRPLPLANAACAAAIALALGVDAPTVASRLSSLPPIEHRLTVQSSPEGVVVLDDTFNANPAGARLALSALVANGADGVRRVVVTPGMVELGDRQTEENIEFARLVGGLGADLVAVGTTNRAALVEGYRAEAPGQVVWVARREDAVAWVRRELGAGDVVLYENDLPDHFP